MAIWYVDNTAVGLNTGTSWTDAWTSIAGIVYASVNASDTIYISGGSTSKTYNEAFSLPTSGTAGNIITISTGQDSGHDGIVIMDIGGNDWLAAGNLAYVHITGNVNGARHLQVSGAGWRWHINTGPRTVTAVRLSYIDFGSNNSCFYLGNNVTQTDLEFDHNWCEKTDGGADQLWYNFGGVVDNGYDSNLMHHNTLYVIASGALGDDLLQWGAAYSFYNNYVKIVKSTYSGLQHGDWFQLNLGHIKIYNNTFEGGAGQGLFISGFGAPSTLTGILFYNNLIINSEIPTNVFGVIILRAFAQPSMIYEDVVVANNTFVDFTDGNDSITFNEAAGYTNCHVKNNLFINSSGLSAFNINASVSTSNNSSLNSGAVLVSHTQYAVSTNDLHLAASDTVALDQGADLSSLIPALDYDGRSRPVGAAWDIGAYEFQYIQNAAVVICRTLRWM